MNAKYFISPHLSNISRYSNRMTRRERIVEYRSRICGEFLHEDVGPSFQSIARQLTGHVVASQARRLSQRCKPLEQAIVRLMTQKEQGTCQPLRRYHRWTQIHQWKEVNVNCLVSTSTLHDSGLESTGCTA